MLRKIKIPPKSLFLIFLILASLILTYSIIELLQRKKEITKLMVEQSHSLLETTLAASKTSLESYETINSEMKSRLINNGNFIKLLFEQDKLTNKILEKISEENNIYRINIFDRNGNKIFTNHKPIHSDLEEKFSPIEFLYPIFEGTLDTLFLGVKQARYKEGSRFAVALSAKNNSAIVLNIDAKELLNFRKSVGFGALLISVTQNKGVHYAVLQDSNGIIAASGNIENLGSLINDQFLINSLTNNQFTTRILDNDSVSIFEAVHPFSYKNETIGLLRLGLSTEPLYDVTEGNERRIMLMGIILFILGSTLLAYVFKNQNFELLKKDFEIVENYSQKVIQNVSDCVIVFDSDYKIKTFNKASESLFLKTQDEVIGIKLKSLFDNKTLEKILEISISASPIETKINGNKKYLLISKSDFFDRYARVNSILVIRDITKQKLMEEQINRKEQLIAMGELASGVAHEIRNPLNTISTITQQLNKDFEPKENVGEYHLLANLVNKEIKRINKTVSDFLKFSRPEQISLNEFKLSDLINQIYDQYKSLLKEKSIIFNKSINWNGTVNWDRNQIQQVLINLMRNSIDSILSKGRINLDIKINKDIVELTFSDTGSGIPKNIFNKIFNIYYTTKPTGTGVGLSIVQRIIYEHNGTIEFESEENTGTTFYINIPIRPNLG